MMENVCLGNVSAMCVVAEALALLFSSVCVCVCVCVCLITNKLNMVYIIIIHKSAKHWDTEGMVSMQHPQSERTSSTHPSMYPPLPGSRQRWG